MSYTSDLTILIRTSSRPVAFNKCLASINGEAEVIVCYDNPAAVAYIPPNVTKFYVSPNDEPYGYNKYCNSLSECVNDGWFMFVDDDDTVIPGSLSKLKSFLLTAEPGAIIIQFMRGTYLKPHPAIFAERKVREGHIGLPCLVLHSEYKNAAMVNAGEYADSHYIREVLRHVPATWVRNLPVVSSAARGFGKMEN